MGTKQTHLQLLTALSDVLEKSRQSRGETVSTISALRSQLSALAACRSLNVMGTLPFEQMQQSAQHSESYNELLCSRYREKCSSLQEELIDTKARLSASESRVQNLEVLHCRSLEVPEFVFLSNFFQPLPALCSPFTCFAHTFSGRNSSAQGAA
jgi:hypothetical protein